MGNRVAAAGVSAAYTTKLIRNISITPDRAVGNKNVMRDKRVKAYSNSRPVLLTLMSTVVHEPHCVRDPFAKAFNHLNGSMANLSLDRIPNSENRLQSLSSERRFFFRFFESIFSRIFDDMCCDNVLFILESKFIRNSKDFNFLNFSFDIDIINIYLMIFFLHILSS